MKWGLSQWGGINGSIGSLAGRRRGEGHILRRASFVPMDLTTVGCIEYLANNITSDLMICKCMRKMMQALFYFLARESWSEPGVVFEVP